MKGMKKIFYVVFVVLLNVSCISQDTKSYIKVRQGESSYPIVIRKSKENGKIWAIDIPYVFYVSKKTIEKIELRDFRTLSSLCSDIPTISLMYVKRDNDLIYPKSNDKIRFLRFKELECVVYIQYFNLYEIQDIQNWFSRDLENMRIENKDTLHIGNIQQLKSTTPHITKYVSQDDSVKILLYYKDSYHNIKVPIEFK